MLSRRARHESEIRRLLENNRLLEQKGLADRTPRLLPLAVNRLIYRLI
jgi:hypothetical protein